MIPREAISVNCPPFSGSRGERGSGEKQTKKGKDSRLLQVAGVGVEAVPDVWLLTACQAPGKGRGGGEGGFVKRGNTTARVTGSKFSAFEEKKPWFDQGTLRETIPSNSKGAGGRKRRGQGRKGGKKF